MRIPFDVIARQSGLGDPARGWGAAIPFCAGRAALLLLVFALLVSTPAMGAEDGYVPQLLKQLDAADPEARRHALLGLAEAGGFDTVPNVAKALHDEDPVARKLAESALWSIWMRSGNEELDQLMQVGTRLLGSGNAGQSVRVFSLIIERAPEYAEGWNKRATAYYHIGEYRKSLQDIDKTLKLNPYHFGALSGAGLCLIELQDMEQAIGYFERALKINPNLDNIQELKDAVQKRAGAKKSLT